MNLIADFVKIERSEIIEQINNIIKNQAEWVDIYNSSTSQMFVQMAAVPGEITLYYIQRAKSEMYISTARLKSSVINIAKLLNYNPRRNVSASGTVLFTLDAPALKTIIIPARTILQSGNGLPYVTRQDVTIPVGSSSVSVDIIQGEWIVSDFVSNGQPNQKFEVTDTAVENDNVVVINDNKVWNKVSSFVESQSDSLDYVLTTTLSETIQIELGDAVNGKIPDTGSTVSVEYIRSVGLDGNVDSLGYVTVIVSPIYDVNGNAISNITVTNTTKILGGEDIETVNEIKFNAPRVFRTGDRAVTKDDHIAILEDIPGIKTANVWGEREENAPNAAMRCIVKISILLENWLIPDSNFKTLIADFLYDNKSMLTVVYLFEDPVFVEVLVVDNVYTTSSYSLSEIRSRVDSKIDALFGLNLLYDDNGVRNGGVTVGESVRYSNVDRQIDALEGVKHHNLSLLGYQLIGTGNGILQDFSDTLLLEKATPFTVFIVISGVEVAVDDGAGTIVEIASSGVNGTIDYTSGVVAVHCDAAPLATEEVRVQFKPTYSDVVINDLVVARNQIVKLHSKRINVAYG